MKYTKKNEHFSHKKTYKRKVLDNKKNKKGGTPKINFAYTYFILDFATFRNNFESFSLLNYYLLSKSKQCNCISANIPLSKCSTVTENKELILNNDQEKIILVMKYNDFVDVTMNPNLFQNPAFLQHILGHTKTIEYHINGNKIIGLYDVCLHLFNKKGYGAVLFNVVLTALNFYISDQENAWLWLGIRLDNIQFEKVANLCTTRGFENPYLDTRDITGMELGFPFIALTKKLHSYVTNEDDTYISFAKTMDLYQQVKMDMSIPNYTCRLKFTLDKSAILSLRLFPYISREGISNVLLKNSQFESSGAFNLFNANIDSKNEVTYKLSLETLADNKGIKYVKGDNENVFVPLEPCTFHTHPIGLYIKYEVLLGPPSGVDFKWCYTLIPYQFQFHMVISIEGIYIISLSKSALENPQFQVNLDSRFLNKIADNYEYPFDLRPFNWKSNGALDDTIIPDAIQKYVNWFSLQNKKMNNLFELQFIPWKQLQRDTAIEIHYSKKEGRCYPSIYQPNFIEKLTYNKEDRMEVDDDL